MKNRIFSLIAILALALGLASCNDDNWNPNTGSTDEGTLSLKALGVEIDDSEEVVATSRSSVDISGFIIEIVKGEEEEVVQKWTYSTMPEVFTLEAGEYTANVRSHDIKDAEWDAPYYAGSNSFTITKNEVTEIGTITCTFQSVRVSVTFTDELKEAMGDDCVVDVEVGSSGTSMQFDSDHYDSSAYFRPIDGSMTLIATFKGTVQGNYVETDPYTFTDVAAGKHYRLNYSAKSPNDSIPEETGTIDVGNGITLSTDILGVDDITGNVVDEEGNIVSTRPGKEDPKEEDTLYFYGNIDNAGWTVESLTSNAYTFTVTSSASFTFTTDSTGADSTKAWGTSSASDQEITANGSYSAVAAASGKFVISTAGTYTVTVNQSAKTFEVSGFASESIEITCETLSFDSANELGDTSPEGKVKLHADNKIAHLYVKIETTNSDFSSAVSEFLPMEFDLAYPGEYSNSFASLGFPVGDDVIGKTDLVFDITQFIPLLAAYQGEHKFTITIEDQSSPANSLAKTLTFVKN